MSFDIVFVLIAKRDYGFFSKVADRLSSQGKSIAFISFVEYDSSKYPMFYPFKHEMKGSFEGIEQKLSFSLRDLIRHDVETFNASPYSMIEKAGRYIEYMDVFFSKYSVGCVIQEIGGFVANLSVYYMARKHSEKHIFIEPSFFKNRALFLIDSINPPELLCDDINMSPEVKTYMDNYHSKHLVSYSDKDKSHYTSSFEKFLKYENWKALSSKLVDITTGRYTEFRYPINHVKRYVSFFVNDFFSSTLNYYSKLEDVEEGFIYFPLHVPGDFQLTTRAPEYLDQLKVVEYILKSAPINKPVVIKQHPAMRGSLSCWDVRRLKSLYRNFFVLESSINNYEVLKKSGLVITINSKSGFEAMVLERPLICLSNTFYSHLPGVNVSSIDRLRKELNQAMFQAKATLVDSAVVDLFLLSLFENTKEFNLYNNSAKNLDKCAEAIEEVLSFA
ncbi:hypothetical protein [Marinomonas mediterranea]|uniref:capsular polysaccharide export protein, LipB/KpsS family n=1 Tax=Marinomonas mediterranea TaxID=119864 RepID=UPI00167F57E1|nr:hypothetical protein [Marinomonas mediterranea]WCN12095.1 hypothetical protein GV054_03200 [Marinomonas mediterranea]WCN16133.1 hypothetical protein GV053_03135 [Marinomonas mediterranea MMB-1]